MVCSWESRIWLTAWPLTTFPVSLMRLSHCTALVCRGGQLTLDLRTQAFSTWAAGRVQMVVLGRPRQAGTHSSRIRERRQRSDNPCMLYPLCSVDCARCALATDMVPSRVCHAHVHCGRDSPVSGANVTPTQWDRMPLVYLVLPDLLGLLLPACAFCHALVKMLLRLAPILTIGWDHRCPCGHCVAYSANLMGHCALTPCLVCNA